MNYYDRAGNPISPDEAGGLRAMIDARVALDIRGDVRVSTVWLGLNHEWNPAKPPLIFETMVFGGEHDEEQWRWSTEAEALAGHAEICSAVFRGST